MKETSLYEDEGGKPETAKRYLIKCDDSLIYRRDSSAKINEILEEMRLKKAQNRLNKELYSPKKKLSTFHKGQESLSPPTKLANELLEEESSPDSRMEKRDDANFSSE